MTGKKQQEKALTFLQPMAAHYNAEGCVAGLTVLRICVVYDSTKPVVYKKGTRNINVAPNGTVPSDMLFTRFVQLRIIRPLTASPLYISKEQCLEKGLLKRCTDYSLLIPKVENIMFITSDNVRVLRGEKYFVLTSSVGSVGFHYEPAKQVCWLYTIEGTVVACKLNAENSEQLVFKADTPQGCALIKKLEVDSVTIEALQRILHSGNESYYVCNSLVNSYAGRDMMSGTFLSSALQLSSSAAYERAQKLVSTYSLLSAGKGEVSTSHTVTTDASLYADHQIACIMKKAEGTVIVPQGIEVFGCKDYGVGSTMTPLHLRLPASVWRLYPIYFGAGSMLIQAAPLASALIHIFYAQVSKCLPVMAYREGYGAGCSLILHCTNAQKEADDVLDMTKNISDLNEWDVDFKSGILPAPTLICPIAKSRSLLTLATFNTPRSTVIFKRVPFKHIPAPRKHNVTISKMLASKNVDIDTLTVMLQEVKGVFRLKLEAWHHYLDLSRKAVNLVSIDKLERLELFLPTRALVSVTGGAIKTLLLDMTETHSLINASTNFDDNTALVLHALSELFNYTQNDNVVHVRAVVNELEVRLAENIAEVHECISMSELPYGFIRHIYMHGGVKYLRLNIPLFYGWYDDAEDGIDITPEKFWRNYINKRAVYSPSFRVHVPKGTKSDVIVNTLAYMKTLKYAADEKEFNFNTVIPARFEALLSTIVIADI